MFIRSFRWKQEHPTTINPLRKYYSGSLITRFTPALKAMYIPYHMECFPRLCHTARTSNNLLLNKRVKGSFALIKGLYKPLFPWGKYPWKRSRNVELSNTKVYFGPLQDSPDIFCSSVSNKMWIHSFFTSKISIHNTYQFTHSFQNLDCYQKKINDSSLYYQQVYTGC